MFRRMLPPHDNRERNFLYARAQLYNETIVYRPAAKLGFERCAHLARVGMTS